MSHRLVIKDAFRQIVGRVLSALAGFLVIKIISPYLGPLRYGDYSTILKYFAIRSALADFGLYVIAVKEMGIVKEEEDANNTGQDDKKYPRLQSLYGKFVGTRIVTMSIVYLIALLVAYFLPAYTSNPYLVRGLPLGMLFSATFMGAGIVQLPLQIFRKMEKLSVGLVVARIIQLIVLVVVVYGIFTDVHFQGLTTMSLIAFLLVILSVVVSGLTQRIYVQRQSVKILPLRLQIDRSFIKRIFRRNRQYGFAYYISSFHTLMVLIFLSNFFPTVDGYSYTGIWALALALMEIFLIIPASLGNSLLHKVANYSTTKKRQSFANLVHIVFWLGLVVAANFFLFNEEIIHFVSGESFIGTGLGNPGANTILPFLGIVLVLSFVKQVFNYLFVATNKQNVLLPINLIGVIIGLAVGIYAIPQYGIVGGIVTQVLLEILFVAGAFFAAARYKVFPYLSTWRILILTTIIGVLTWIGRQFFPVKDFQIGYFIGVVFVFNLLIFLGSFPLMKRIARGLTQD